MKKATPAQLAARKKFTAMAKSGELAKKRATASKKKPSLKKPASKGLTTLCAKTVGVTGRRKKDGTQKKGYVASKGGTLKKKAPVKKGLKAPRKEKYLVKFWKDKEVIKTKKVYTKVEAEKEKRAYLQSFHMTKKVAEGRQATISKL